MVKEIEDIFKKNQVVKSTLESTKNFSHALSVEKQLTNYLITTIGCYFENKFYDILIEYTTKNSSDILSNVLYKDFIYKRYHSYFTWDAQKTNGINTLLSKFGEEFSKSFRELISNDPKLKDSILIFLDLGNLRNLVSHEYLFEVKKTSNEIFEAFQEAMYFLEKFQSEINKHKIGA
ncbi:MAG: hypothetical protein OEV44_15045 [Spirochaetota bacterium]|nr:hypothetical protein [Spirochaetota bacterium]